MLYNVVAGDLINYYMYHGEGKCSQCARMQYFISLESNPSTDHIHNFKPVRFTRSIPFFFSKECGKKKTQQENQVYHILIN